MREKKNLKIREKKSLEENSKTHPALKKILSLLCKVCPCDMTILILSFILGMWLTDDKKVSVPMNEIYLATMETDKYAN